MITALFYLTAAIALFCTIMVVTRYHAVHALLYLIVAQLAVALIFFLLGAPFAAALEVLVYAGAIMVMFIFVIMMLNLGSATLEQEKAWLPSASWGPPLAICAILLVELLVALADTGPLAAHWVGPKVLGITLFGPYLLAVELASMLLLAGLVGAYHLARPYLQAPSLRAGDPPSQGGTRQPENGGSDHDGHD